MSLTSTTFGNFNLYTIDTGEFKLDGGSMFGVVPKALWSKKIEPDDKNRIPMRGRCLLIESKQTDRVYLVDNGCGTKFDEKNQSIYGIDRRETSLESSLDFHGFSFSDVTDLVFTHLHFDHCGGSTYYDESGILQHAFPQSRYHVTRTHWKTANHPNVREKASFFKENIQPLGMSERLHLSGDKHRYEEGFTILTVHGHTRGQQLPVLESGDQTLIFAADLIPTAAHVPMPWIMGFDMCARETLEEKEYFLRRASEEGWLLYLEHDHATEMIRVEQKEGRYQVKEKLTLDEV